MLGNRLLRLRVAVAVLGLVSVALLSQARAVLDLGGTARRVGADGVSRSEARFRVLKASLPHRGVVGYLSDRADVGAYYLAQYSLVPLIVDRSVDHEWVVGNFFDARRARAHVADANLVVVEDFGAGLLLLRRRGR